MPREIQTDLEKKQFVVTLADRQACLSASARGTTIAIFQSRHIFRGSRLCWLGLGGGWLPASLARPPAIPIPDSLRDAWCVARGAWCMWCEALRGRAGRCEVLRGDAGLDRNGVPPRTAKNLNRNPPPAHGLGAYSPKICVMPKACEARQSRDRRQPELASCRA